jgi:endonuclease-3
VAKRPFDIDAAFVAIRVAVAPFPRAALFELYDEGFQSAFEQLVACMISIRTRDETMLPLARRLFSQARTPADVAALSTAAVDELIHQSAFHESKAIQIKAIARRAIEEFNGTLPCDYATLVSLPGVGAKCANLVLGLACGQPRIGVDIHVHRITNRWGVVHTTTPTATLAVLEQILPTQYWVEINRLLVPFGKHICTGVLPRCSTCPLLEMCAQVSITEHR